MAELGYNDTKQEKRAYETVHPDEHQKGLHGTLENVQHEIEVTERRLRELHLIRRSCQSGLEAFEKQDEAPADRDEGWGR